MPRGAKLASPIVRPGRQTRVSSLATVAWSGANIAPKHEVTTSNSPSANGSASTSPSTQSSSTPREREVLDLVSEGLTNRKIAERLVVSEHTVHRHVTNILRKLDLPSRAAAAAYAVRLGLVDK